MYHLVMNGKGYLHINLYRGGMNTQGSREGFGVQIFPNGCIYAGFWANNQANGIGKLILPDSTSIEGQYKNNIIQCGTVKYFNGCTFEGSFEGDINEKFMQGRFEFLSGLKFYGQWSNGVIQAGRLTDPDGNVLNDFTDSNITYTSGRYGIIVPKNEKWIYEGEIFNSKPNGIGTIFSTFLQYYHGSFEEERIKGTTYRMRIQWGEISEGSCIKNKKVGKWKRLLTRGYEIIGDVYETKGTVRFPYMNDDSFVGELEINWKSDDKPYKCYLKSGKYYYCGEDSVVREIDIKEPLQSIYQISEVKQRGLNFQSVFNRITQQHPKCYSELSQFVIKCLKTNIIQYNSLHPSLQKRLRISMSDIESSGASSKIPFELNLSSTNRSPSPVKGLDDLSSNYIIEGPGVIGSLNMFSKFHDDTILSPLINLVNADFNKRIGEIDHNEVKYASLSVANENPNPNDFGTNHIVEDMQFQQMSFKKSNKDNPFSAQFQKLEAIKESRRKSAIPIRTKTNNSSPNSSKKNNDVVASNNSLVDDDLNRSINRSGFHSNQFVKQTPVFKDQQAKHKQDYNTYSKRNQNIQELNTSYSRIDRPSGRNYDSIFKETLTRDETNNRASSALPIKPQNSRHEVFNVLGKDTAQVNSKRKNEAVSQKNTPIPHYADPEKAQFSSNQRRSSPVSIGEKTRSNSYGLKSVEEISVKAPRNKQESVLYVEEKEEVDYFNGKIVKGLMQGHCQVLMSNGVYKEASFQQHRMDGQGAIYNSNGVVYNGQFKNNLLDGHGMIKVDDLTVEGQFSEGEFKTNRVQVLKNGIVIIAEKEMADPVLFQGPVRVIFSNGFSLDCKMRDNNILTNQTCNVKDRFGNLWVGELKREDKDDLLTFVSLSVPKIAFRVSLTDDGNFIKV
jgi:hypothetical protein